MIETQLPDVEGTGVFRSWDTGSKFNIEGSGGQKMLPVGARTQRV